MLSILNDYTWEILVGCAIGIPILLYLGGYFWTRGSLNAKSEFLCQELKSITKKQGDDDDTRF